MKNSGQTPKSARPEMRSDLHKEEDRFRSLFRVTTAASTDFKSQLQEVLRISAEQLGIHMGVVSQVNADKGTYKIYSVFPPDGPMSAGAVLPLEHTYCQVMLEAGKVTAVCPVSASPIAQRSCYQLLPFETYIGTSLYVNDEFFGTICLVSAEARPAPFDEVDEVYIELVGKWIGKMLEIEFQKEQLIQQNTRLTQLNQQLDQFIYSVSHDLKQPVININNMIGLISSHITTENAIVDKAMGYLRLATDKLKNTVDELLEISRISHTEAVFERIVISEVLQQNIQYFRDSYGEQNWTIKTDFADCDELHFPPVYFNSIVNNLLSNAIKYRSPDRELQVRLKTYRRGAFIVFDCQDNGLGVDLAKSGDKIFALFKRLHDHVEGSGVGLHIVKKIIDKYQGDIQLESAPDQGFNIKIFFPIHQKQLNE
ncbi:MAG: HAMP domain-containing sensor histidine kinase [Bacteroidota bacterium]